MEVTSIHPINDNHLIQLEDRNEGRIIHLGGKRSISGTRRGTCVRSPRFENASVLVSQGGTPYGDGNLFFLPETALIRINDLIQEPYVHISPIELNRSELIHTPAIYSWSGWYVIIDIFENAELEVGTKVLPIYGTPSIEEEDGTEYIDISGIGVIQC